MAVGALLSLPGIAIAVLAKQFAVGEGGLFLGLFLAFVAPIVWLARPRT
ncbi:MAG: hypothetical protein AB7O59_16730 [Pirellulales bacterium]